MGHRSACRDYLYRSRARHKEFHVRFKFQFAFGFNVTAVISSAQSEGFDPTVTLFGTIFGFVLCF